MPALQVVMEEDEDVDMGTGAEGQAAGGALPAGAAAAPVAG